MGTAGLLGQMVQLAAPAKAALRIEQTLIAGPAEKNELAAGLQAQVSMAQPVRLEGHFRQLRRAWNVI